ncbi:hypothetical protein GCM10007362_42180 [Saccharibacillus endophyticus]|uniref:Uncharacterized protein n=1 Tax=Saccharibacillus endophyticus TaxID=2060666 RepID=A0ABQ2A5C9_9BACL|nr:hypothetical protein GCM10007362_42180 [Saccharibacillus endophyticus]
MKVGSKSLQLRQFENGPETIQLSIGPHDSAFKLHESNFVLPIEKITEPVSYTEKPECASIRAFCAYPGIFIHECVQKNG